jgi:hypothetical protein
MGGDIFRTSPDLPWDPASFLYNGYRVFSPAGEAAGDLYSLDIVQIEKNEMDGACSTHGRGVQIEKNEMDGACSTHGRGEVYTGFWCGNLREREHLVDPGLGGREVLRWVFRKWDVEPWAGSMWQRIGTGGGHL